MNATGRSLLVVAAAITVDLLFWDGDVALANGAAIPLWLPVLLTVSVHSSLLWRRQRPLPVFGVQLCFAMVTVAVPFWQPVAGLLVATFAVAANTPSRTARWGWLVAVPLLCHALTLGLWSNTVAGVLQAAALHLAAGAAAWTWGRRVHHRSRQLRDWHADQERLHVEAATSERIELARELHDGVANTITAVLVQASAARAAATGDPDTLHDIERSARRAMEEIQAALRLMPRGPDGSSGPTLDDLPSLFDVGTAAGLDMVHTQSGIPRPLEPAASTAAYRAVQEGITNTLKYAPPGTRCLVSLAWGTDELVIDVIDQPARTTAPRPTLPATGGRGLAGLSDRLRTVGGAVESGAHGSGFKLEARLPVGAR